MQRLRGVTRRALQDGARRHAPRAGRGVTRRALQDAARRPAPRGAPRQDFYTRENYVFLMVQ